MKYSEIIKEIQTNPRPVILRIGSTDIKVPANYVIDSLRSEMTNFGDLTDGLDIKWDMDYKSLLLVSD